jgi:hypothetical protein
LVEKKRRNSVSLLQFWAEMDADADAESDIDADADAMAAIELCAGFVPSPKHF